MHKNITEIKNTNSVGFSDILKAALVPRPRIADGRALERSPQGQLITAWDWGDLASLHEW